MYGTFCYIHFIITGLKYVFSLSTSSHFAEAILLSAINKSRYIHDFFHVDGVSSPRHFLSSFWWFSLSYLMYVNFLWYTILIILAVPCECHVERWNKMIKRFSGAHHISHVCYYIVLLLFFIVWSTALLLPKVKAKQKHCFQFMDRYPHIHRRENV